jgi:hypothetical protein
MIILLEESKYTDITLASIAAHCSTGMQTIVTDNVDMFVDENTHLTDPMFVIRGDSIKILTDQFEKFVQSELTDLKYFSLAKQYPGAYFKDSFPEAYKLSGISNYAKCFDTDVMLINPEHYRVYKNADIISLKDQGNVSLMFYNLNAKDDFLMTQIMGSYHMLEKNIWYHKKAGLINFSIDIITIDDVESCVLMPFDLLNSYTKGTGIDLENNISRKAEMSKELFGKIKETML